MTSYSYSEQELKDNRAITDFLCLTESPHLGIITNFFSDPTNMNVSVPFFLHPPPRCSDNKRRNFSDYVDFLFEDPPIEDVVTTVNNMRAEFTMKLEISPQNNFLTVTWTRN
jgi:site-specific DNA-adenine methylase